MSSTDLVDQGIALYRGGNYREAQDTFDMAVDRRPDSAAAYMNRGAARVRTGNVSGAVSDYTRALDLNPLDPDVYYNRGNAFMLMGLPAEAIADYSRAIELRPSDAAAYFNRGTAKAVADIAGARADWAYAASIEPDPDVRTMMVMNIPTPGGPVPLGSETISASPPTLSSREPLPAEPVDARALAARGVAREIDGDRAGARADLQAAVALETDPVRRAALERLLRFLDAPQ
jgi:tetratricopeptide (TPR) repeat protein